MGSFLDAGPLITFMAAGRVGRFRFYHHQEFNRAGQVLFPLTARGQGLERGVPAEAAAVEGLPFIIKTQRFGRCSQRRWNAMRGENGTF